jgi:hypothetical protein
VCKTILTRIIVDRGIYKFSDPYFTESPTEICMTSIIPSLVPPYTTSLMILLHFTQTEGPYMCRITHRGPIRGDTVWKILTPIIGKYADDGISGKLAALKM